MINETPEEQGQDAAELSDQEAEETIPSTEGGDPAKPVDDPDLPEDGDPEDFEEEHIPDEEFDQYAENNDTMDNREEAEEPNDLSGIDKEFDDDED